MTDREIAIPIAPDGPTPEAFESFLLRIDSLQGGAGLGGQATRVEIAADGAPAGQFFIQAELGSVREGQSVEVLVDRLYYGSGEVSVTVTPSGEATAGEDYELEPAVLTWPDGEQGPRSVRITARSDDLDEQPFEELILTLTNPTGGAILGAQASASVSIVDPTPPGGSRGGSGRLGWVSLLALCAAGLPGFARLGRAPAARSRRPTYFPGPTAPQLGLRQAVGAAEDRRGEGSRATIGSARASGVKLLFLLRERCRACPPRRTVDSALRSSRSIATLSNSGATARTSACKFSRFGCWSCWSNVRGTS
jgi:hypothetical protein